jgi:hypothetical protein
MPRFAALAGGCYIGSQLLETEAAHLGESAMNRWGIVLTFVVACSWMGGAIRAAEQHKENSMVAHDVYFTLNDASPTAKQQLVEACQKYLSGHPGMVWFSVGTRAPEFARDVNDKEFDVALHLVFKDKAAHDQYQIADRHNQFIKLCKPNWKTVRVFDSHVEGAAQK